MGESMTEKTLSTGKKVFIRKLSRPVIRECKNHIKMRNFPDGSHVFEGLNDAQDAWIENGLGGLGDWKAKNGEIAPDDVIMQLNDLEQSELAKIIQEAQIVNPSKPSHSD
jgi:hypothetical protein